MDGDNGMKIKVARCYRTYAFSTVLFFILFTRQVVAGDCAYLTDTVNQQLLDMHADIIGVTSREQYEKVIQKRYDRVEGLLKIAADCSKNNGVWTPVKDKFAALRSNARSLAFRNFDNWLEIREKDLALFTVPDVTKKPMPQATANNGESN